MENQALIELGQRELSTLQEFLSALHAERDSIISFSLEGVIKENNRKEEILKRLEYLEIEKEKILSAAPDRTDPTEKSAWHPLAEQIQEKVREVRTALEKNMKLLTFSMDHVKTSVEKIVDFINRSSYEKGRSVSIMVSREV
jgi:flagellar biosynthesis/type III secretory pathway chaperone